MKAIGIDALTEIVNAYCTCGGGYGPNDVAACTACLIRHDAVRNSVEMESARPWIKFGEIVQLPDGAEFELHFRHGGRIIAKWSDSYKKWRDQAGWWHRPGVTHYRLAGPGPEQP